MSEGGVGRSTVGFAFAPIIRTLGWVVGLASVSSFAFSHDLWLIPGKFGLTPGERVRVFINNGDQFPESITLLGHHRVRRLEWIHTDGSQRISETNADGRSLSFTVTAPSSGHAALSLETQPRTVRLTIDDFRTYLEDEKQEQLLDGIPDGEAPRTAVIERYQKYAKALLRVRAPEPGTESVWGRSVGHRLEIVPTQGANRFVTGEGLAFRVLLSGEPVNGIRLTAGRSDEPPVELGLTDIEGLVEARFEHPGRWFVRAFIIQAVPAESLEADYESLWATLTFEILSP